jgi:hypothetical protein
MAPEVYAHRPYHQAADVFSWAMLAWELLSGQLLSSWVVEHTAEGCRAYRAAVAAGWRPPWPQELAGGRLGAACQSEQDTPAEAQAGGVELCAEDNTCSAEGMAVRAKAASGGLSSSSSSSHGATAQGAATAAAARSLSAGAAEVGLLADAIQEGLKLSTMPAAAGATDPIASSPATAPPPAAAAAAAAAAGARAERVRRQLLQQVVQLVERCWCGAPEGRPGMSEVAAVMQQAVTVLQMAEDAAAAAAGGPSGAASVSSYHSTYRSSSSGVQGSSPVPGGRVSSGPPPCSHSSTQQLDSAWSSPPGRTSLSLGGLDGPQACPAGNRGRCCLQ